MNRIEIINYVTDVVVGNLKGGVTKGVIADVVIEVVNSLLGFTDVPGGVANVGIGVEEPRVKLDVGGDLMVSGDASVSGSLDAQSLPLPSSPPSNPIPGKFYLYAEDL